jgi:serine/threonine-protein kinase
MFDIIIALSLVLAEGAVVAGRYELERPLGQGGMGVVWAARHTVTKKRVALKFLRGPAVLRPDMRRRFLREARAASAVIHPNLVEVHDVFELDDQVPVMVMELLEGETLGQKIARDGALGLAETCNLLLPVVSAVGTAHAAGVVHRDLKPDNVFLSAKSSGAQDVRVLDFGIAKLVGADFAASETGNITETGSMLGTPCYMSPEQSFGEKDIDHRADVWSLGVMLYECLAGSRPVEGDSIGQVVKRLMTEGIVPIEVITPELPPEVATLIDRMLSRDREGRPDDLREVAAVLERFCAAAPIMFGPARAERSDSSPPDALKVVIGPAGADPTTRTEMEPPSGLHTGAAHTFTPRKRYARSGGITAIVAGALLVALLLSVSREQREQASPSAASMTRPLEIHDSLAATLALPVAATARPPPLLVPDAGSGASTPTARPTLKARKHVGAAPSAGAAGSPSSSATSPALAPPAPSASPLREGLAEEMPF